jgi:hypothetical protein
MFLLSGGKLWLVIRGQGASGSGISLYIDSIFEIRGGRLQRVISYAAEGFQSGAPDGPNREFSARVVSFEVNHGQATAEFDLNVAYSVPDHKMRSSVLLFRKRQRATLTRRLNGGTSHVDASRSNLSERELDAVYNLDSMGENDFLKYNFAELSRVAAGKNDVRKDWLRGYLKTVQRTATARELEQMLAR